MTPVPTLSARTVAIISIFAPCLLCVPRNQVPTLVVLFAAATVSVWIGRFNDIATHYLRRHVWHRRAMIGCASLLFAFLAIGPTLSARWSQMDDHELARILGDDHQLGLQEMVQQLAVHKEVGAIGSFNRVRPTYYIIRYAEAFLWGDNLTAWYAARVIVFACVLSLCWTLLWHWLGTIDSSLTLVLFACFRMWGDLWARIGASETYAMVGIAVAVIGIRWIEQSQNGRSRNRERNPESNAPEAGLSEPGRIAPVAGLSEPGSDAPVAGLFEPGGWLALAFGTIIAMGCKENFLVLAPAVLMYAIYAGYKRRLGVTGIVATCMVLACGGFLASKILSSLAATDGLDIYAKKRSLETLLFSAAESVTLHFGAVLLLVICFLGWTAWRCRQNEKLRTLCPKIRTTIVALFGLLLLFTSQFAFYDGFSAFGDRYAFPAALAPLLTIPLLAKLWNHYKEASDADSQSILTGRQRMRFVMVAIVCVMGISMQRKSARRVESSRAFTHDIEVLAGQCHSSPDEPVLFISNGTGDYEALYSVHTFLRYYRVENPIFLKVEEGVKLDQCGQLAQSLLGRLQQASTNGDEAFQPIDRLPPDGAVLHVSFQNNRKYGADTVSFSSYR